MFVNNNDSEQLLLNYLKLQNTQESVNTKNHIKTKVSSKISELQTIIDSKPKPTEEDKKQSNLILNQYFQETNKNTVPNLENLFIEKEILEKKINEKKEAIELLKDLSKSINSKIINPKLIDSINTNSILFRNQNVKNAIEFLNMSQVNVQENEDLTKEQKYYIAFRNLIKNSFEDIQNNTTTQTTPLKLFSDLNIEKINLEEIISPDDNKEIINELANKICISPSFEIFLRQLYEYYYNNVLNNYNKSNFIIFCNIINLLITMHEIYYKKIDTDISNAPILILMHNNLEIFTFLLNYFVLFHTNLDGKVTKIIFNIMIKIKNTSELIFSQVIANFTEQLSSKMEIVEDFKRIREEKKYRICLDMIHETQKMIFDFFDKLRIFAIHRKTIFNFNNVLSLYFCLLNTKIVKDNDYYISDIKSLLSLSEEISKDLKNNIEQLSKKDMDLSVKFMNILETNYNYKKFKNILFVLSSNLKEIKNHLVNNNYEIHMDKKELVVMIKSTFQESQTQKDLIELIENKVRKASMNN